MIPKLSAMMRKMGAEMGEDLPAEFDEVVDRLEAGQSPKRLNPFCLIWEWTNQNRSPTFPDVGILTAKSGREVS